MKDISEILKEAKPLYYRKARIRKRAQRVFLTIFMILMVFASGYGGYAIKSSTADYTADSDSYNVIESFYPQDEYGLITVAY